MRRHRNTAPYWLTAKFPGACSCGTKIPKGAKALYSPSNRTVQCQPCGEQYERDLAADDFDQMGNGCL